MSGKFTKCCDCAEKACPDRKAKKADMEEQDTPKTMYELVKTILIQVRALNSAWEQSDTSGLLPEEIIFRRQKIENLNYMAEKLFRAVLNSGSVGRVDKIEGMRLFIPDYSSLAKMSIRDIDVLTTGA